MKTTKSCLHICLPLFVIVFALLLTSCSDKSIHTEFSPTIIEGESSSAMPSGLKEIFLNFDYPPGIIPVACYVDSISPAIRTGSYADELFEEIADKYEGTGSFQKRGMLVLVSESPRLIQVRVGDKYSTYCSMVGATSGNEYLSLQQQLTDKSFEDVFPHFLEVVTVRIDELNAISLYKKWRMNDVIGFISRFLDYAGSPSENFYGSWFLRPIMIVIAFFSNASDSYFIGIFFTLSILLIGRYFLILWLSKLTKQKVVIMMNILNFLLGLFFSISVAAAALVLSSGRMEDMIALHSMGIPYIESLIDMVSDYSIGKSILTIFAFILLFELKLIFDTRLFLLNLYPASVQREYYEKSDAFNKGAMLVDSNTDMNEVENSPTPYTVLFRSKMAKDIGLYSFVLGVAAFAILPQVVMYVGIVIAILSLFKTALNARMILKSHNYKNLNENSRIESLWGPIIIVSIVTIVFASAAYFMNPAPNRKDIAYSPTASQVIDSSTLIGNYTLEQSVEGRVTGYGSVMIKQKVNTEFAMLVTWQYDPQTYTLIYDEDAMTFYNDRLGIGEIHYDRELDIIKIIFKIQNTVWTLSK
jgi:hypothetical protein